MHTYIYVYMYTHRYVYAVMNTYTDTALFLLNFSPKHYHKLHDTNTCIHKYIYICMYVHICT